MAASRAARKREMIANLENEEYLNNLVEESYAIIFTQSTTNTVAQKKVKKAFEAGGCHIGAKAKHASWKVANGDFQTVDAFLEAYNPGRLAHRSARCVVTILGTCVFSLESGVRCLARGHPKIRWRL